MSSNKPIIVQVAPASQDLPTFGAAFRAYTQHVEAIPRPTADQRVERVQLRKTLRQAAIVAYAQRVAR